MNELKESIVIKNRLNIKNKENTEKEKFYNKQEKIEERIKMVKEDKAKEKMIKLNKLYISENNLRIKHIREENAKEYKRNLWFQNMDKRRQFLKEKKEKENEDNIQKKKIRDEINRDRQSMLERLKEILKSREEYTKEEINEYVLNGTMPKSKKKADRLKKNLSSNEHSTIEKKEKDDDYGGEEAFITSVPEK